MIIKSLKLKNYRNYDLLDLTFDPKVLIGVEGHVLLKQRFQKIQERTLTRVPFLRH